MISELSWLHISGACGLAVVGGSFRGFAGFGSGLLMAPILTLLVAPSMAVPILMLLSFLASFYLIPEALSDMEPRRVASLGVPALLSIPLGAWLLGTLDATIVQKVISVVVLAMVSILASGWRYDGRLGAPVTIPTGLCSGTLTGLGGVGGPPVVLVLMSDQAEPDTTRANLIGFFAMSQIAALVTFLINGMLTPSVLGLGAAMAPFFLLPLWIGARIFRKSADATYRRAALLVLAVVAVAGLIW